MTELKNTFELCHIWRLRNFPKGEKIYGNVIVRYYRIKDLFVI